MNKKYSFWLSLIVAMSTMCSLMANLICGRTGYFGPFVAGMGVFYFPIIYVLSDIVSEVYGYGVSRKVAWWTNLCNVIFVAGILLVATIVPPTPWALESDAAIKLLLIGTDGATGMIRVVVAGVIGAVLGGWANDCVFQWMKHRDGLKGFWKRKLLSSLVGEIVDTTLFITLAFYGTPVWASLMYFVQFGLKYTVEVLTCPLAGWLAVKLRSIEGEDVFEDRNDFNIFGIRKQQK